MTGGKAGRMPRRSFIPLGQRPDRPCPRPRPTVSPMDPHSKCCPSEAPSAPVVPRRSTRPKKSKPLAKSVKTNTSSPHLTRSSLLRSRFTSDATHALIAKEASAPVAIRNTKEKSTTTVSNQIDEATWRCSCFCRLLPTHVRSERCWIRRGIGRIVHNKVALNRSIARKTGVCFVCFPASFSSNGFGHWGKKPFIFPILLKARYSAQDDFVTNKQEEKSIVLGDFAIRCIVTTRHDSSSYA